MDRYQVLIVWSPEDEVFVAQVPDLPGCMAHGDTEEEALRNAQDAISLYLDDLRECNEPLPEARNYHLLTA